MDLKQIRCAVDLMKVFLEKGDSFTLAKTKALRLLDLTQIESDMMMKTDEYQKAKEEFKSPKSRISIDI